MDVDEEELVGKPADQVPKQEPTDERCMGKRTEKKEGGTVFVGYCRSWPGRGTDHVGEGRCTNHGGHNSGENGQGGTPGNANAVTHGAYAEHSKRHLTQGEQQAYEEVAEKLENPGSAKEIARHAAAHCLMMGHRAEDERWFRRYEGLCDKFNITPEDVKKHEVTGEGGGPVEVVIQRERYSDE